MISTLAQTAVIGHPVRHSRSPMIHGHWLAEYGLAGRYDRVDVSPGELEGFVAALRQPDWRGCNVTVPLKEHMLPLVDRLEPTARLVGAVNTIWKEGSVLVGENTDLYGFMASLDQEVPAWSVKARRALVYGAGGAARAVVHGLVQRGLEVAIVNRSTLRARDLAGAVGAKASAHDESAIDALLDTADLFVNTTSLGMSGVGDVAVDLTRMKPGSIVCDLVYVPLETDLLRSAAALGLPTVGGLGMLLHQAVAGFERWYGVKPEVTAELRTLIEADIRLAR